MRYRLLTACPARLRRARHPPTPARSPSSAAPETCRHRVRPHRGRPWPRAGRCTPRDALARSLPASRAALRPTLRVRRARDDAALPALLRTVADGRGGPRLGSGAGRRDSRLLMSTLITAVDFQQLAQRLRFELHLFPSLRELRHRPAVA